MRILVTGALGTLGTPLVEELNRRGHEVYQTDLRHAHHARFMRADIGDHRQLKLVFEWARPDAVYNLAAEFGRHNGRDFYEQLWRTGAIGMRNVLNLCEAFGAHLIHASSSEIYGEIPQEADDDGLLREHFSETFSLRPGNDYAISKWTGELMCLNEMHRQPITVLRFFNAYGPGEHYHPYRSVVCLFLYRLMMGQEITVFEGYHRVFMYIGDFTPTLANVCERTDAVVGETLNIGGDEYRSVMDLAELCLMHTGADRSLVKTEPFEVHNVRNKRPAIHAAHRILDHAPTVPLERGVPITAQWMRDTYLPAEMRQYGKTTQVV